ncbi:MAG: lipoyl(octanoyl) transferase LipB [Porticoccaceae bacterium]|jgi:lipoyl(octanoyl) transferase|nr:lipoyl(octanoyl) transferase LipB [Porticoccaceae bacterium]MDG1308293.1 lipoyl(octanoyl) transferase LipB [Porticoccaceae bacterium]
MIVRQLGMQRYSPVFADMKAFNDGRDATTEDEIWLLEHEAVFTQGQAGKDEYILVPGDIPVVKSDRGGHVTYHGPGQITAYILVDLKRLKLGVRDLVTLIEQALVDTLAHWHVSATARRDAPGVYTADGAKIASLGLRIRKGCSYHGLNFNVSMDMAPWQRINPCGLDVPMTQLADLVDTAPQIDKVAGVLADNLCTALGYNEYEKN